VFQRSTLREGNAGRKGGKVAARAFKTFQPSTRIRAVGCIEKGHVEPFGREVEALLLRGRQLAEVPQ
jgi:hypothetical protein